MTYSAVGSAYTGTGTTSLSVASVNPTAIGDILVVQIDLNGSSTPAVSGLSHSGVTTWNTLVSTGSTTAYTSVWWGVVTATGSATLTVSNTGTISATAASVQQFHSSVAGTWTADTNTATSTISGTSGNFPSVTPIGADASPLYVGCAYGRNSGGITMSGPGGAWVGSSVSFAPGSDALLGLYNLSPGTGASAPAWTATATIFSGLGFACAGFLYVVASASLFVPPLVISQAVKRASFY